MSFWEIKISDSVFRTPVQVWNKVGSIEISTLFLGDVASFVHPVRVKVLGHVVSNVVREDYNYALVLVFGDARLFDKLESTIESLTRTSTYHKAFFFQNTACHNEAFFVWAKLHVVCTVFIIDTGYEVIACSFDDLTSFGNWLKVLWT